MKWSEFPKTRAQEYSKINQDIFHMTFPKIGLEISFPFSSPPVPC